VLCEDGVPASRRPIMHTFDQYNDVWTHALVGGWLSFYLRLNVYVLFMFIQKLVQNETLILGELVS